MKNIVSLTLLAALLFSCGKGGLFSSASKYEVDEVHVAKVTPLMGDTSGVSCRMNLNVKYVKGDDQRARNVNNSIEQRLFDMSGMTMQQAVDSFAKCYSEEYVRNMRPMFREEDGDEAHRAWYEYTYDITTAVEEGRDGCLIYLMTTDVYEGGAHGICQHLVLNFDAETGHVITLDSIMAEGYQYQLEEMLLAELRRQTKTHSLDELHEQGYLMASEIYAPQNYRLEEDGIVFIYNVYEIAPYATGITELTLTYEQLKKILRH